MSSQYIYKIFRPEEWARFQETKVFAGSPDDLRDGFIHLSEANQLAGTLAKYYTDGADVILAEVDARGLSKALKYETSRGGALFPHLFSDLNMRAVNRHWVIAAEDDKSYVLPELGSPS